MEKTNIVSHTFLGERNGIYTYEISFDKSLEHTCRMDAMCDGLHRYDRYRRFWRCVHFLVSKPLSYIEAGWVKKFWRYTNKKF